MRSSNGLTVVEVMVAILVLSIGLLGLMATAGITTRMIAQGSRYGEVSALAVRRIEIIRSQNCNGMAGGSRTRGKFVETWTVQSLASGRVRTVLVVVESPRFGGVRLDTFTATTLC